MTARVADRRARNQSSDARKRRRRSVHGGDDNHPDRAPSPEYLVIVQE